MDVKQNLRVMPTLSIAQSTKQMDELVKVLTRFTYSRSATLKSGVLGDYYYDSLSDPAGTTAVLQTLKEKQQAMARNLATNNKTLEVIEFPAQVMNFSDFGLFSGSICIPLVNSELGTSRLVSNSSHQEKVNMSIFNLMSLVPTEVGDTADVIQQIPPATLEVAGGGSGPNDSIIPAGTGYQFIKIAQADPLRKTLVAWIVQLKAINTMSAVGNATFWIAGVKNGFDFSLGKIEDTEYIMFLAAAPNRTATVSISAEGAATQTITADPRSYSQFYQTSKITGPSFKVAGVPQDDVVLVCKGNNIQIQVTPIMVTRDILPGLMASISRDSVPFSR